MAFLPPDDQVVIRHSLGRHMLSICSNSIHMFIVTVECKGCTGYRFSFSLLGSCTLRHDSLHQTPQRMGGGVLVLRWEGWVLRTSHTTV